MTDKPKKESCKGDKQFLLRVKWAMWYRIARLALDRGTTRNALITEAIVRYLDEIDPKPPA